MTTTANAMSLGRQHQQARQWVQAEAQFRQVLASEPDNADAHNDLGIALYGLGRFAEAEFSFRRAIFYRHDFVDALYNLAKTCHAQGQWDEAGRLLERSLKLKEPDALVLDALARLYHYQLGNPEKALHYYRQYLTLNPDSADARYRIEALSGHSTLDRMPAEVVASACDQDSVVWDQTVKELGYESPNLLKTALEPGLTTPNSLDVLDLGCGTGLCGLEFQSWARSLTGIDLSPKMLEQARARAIYAELIHDDIIAAPRRFESRFDLVLASDVLLLMGDLTALFQSVHQATRPGGRFAFTVDLHQGPEDYHLTFWAVFGHSRRYLQRLAAETGWQIMSMTDVKFPREKRSQVAGLVVVLRKLIA